MNTLVTSLSQDQSSHSSAFQNILPPEVLRERVPAVFAGGAHERTSPSYTFISTARVLDVGYKSGSREEAIRVVDSVIQSYDQFLKDNYQKNSNGVIALIIKARDELGTELKKLEREYLEFRQKGPAHGSNGQGGTFVARR